MMEVIAVMAEEKYLIYKGKPLIRRGDDIYYGNFDDPYIIEMKVKETKKVGNLDVASKVHFALKDTKTDAKLRELDRDGVYRAIDVADFWLRDALGEI